MGIYKKLKRIFTDFVYKRRMKHLYRGEVKKFKNQKRKAIYSTVVLKKEQKSAIDTLFKNNYGKKVSYVWHRHFTAFTGNFDENYLPETLFIPEFELFMNYDESYIKVFSDKNVVPYLAKSAGVKTPEILLYSVKGTIFKDGEIISFDSACELLKDNGETFVKPTVGTSSGVGCVKANFKDGKDLKGGLKVEEILSRLGKEFSVQKVVKF